MNKMDLIKSQVERIRDLNKKVAQLEQNNYQLKAAVEELQTIYRSSTLKNIRKAKTIEQFNKIVVTSWRHHEISSIMKGEF